MLSTTPGKQPGWIRMRHVSVSRGYLATYFELGYPLLTRIVFRFSASITRGRLEKVEIGKMSVYGGGRNENCFFICLLVCTFKKRVFDGPGVDERNVDLHLLGHRVRD